MSYLGHPRAPLLAALSAAMVIAAAYLPSGAPAAHIAWSAVFFALFASLACIDATTETVPDILTIALVASGILHATAVGAAIIPIGGSALGVLLLGVLHGRITGDKGWIGSGDYFLLAGVVAWFGPVVTLDVLAVASVFLLLHGLLARRATVAVAPALFAASAFIWIGGPIL